MLIHILFVAFLASTTSAFPAKLLKVPKIYNALITTNQKLLPSEAFPASTGPVFQPIGLNGDPVLLNPEAFAKEDMPTAEGDAPRPFSRDGKAPTPLVFYPRYNVYHQLPQSVFPFHNVYQPPPIVVPVQRSGVSMTATSETPPDIEKVVSEEESSESSLLPSPPPPSRMQGFGFVANNRPADSDIPNVPPPPLPVGAPRPQQDGEDGTS